MIVRGVARIEDGFLCFGGQCEDNDSVMAGDVLRGEEKFSSKNP